MNVHIHDFRIRANFGTKKVWKFVENSFFFLQFCVRIFGRHFLQIAKIAPLEYLVSEFASYVFFNTSSHVQDTIQNFKIVKNFQKF